MLLISINSGGGQRPELHKQAIDAAVAAGVRHIAYTSFVNMDNNTSPLAADHRRSEEYLKASGAAWTMLRNHLYMDILLNQAREISASGQAAIVPDETPMGYVTRGDCAAAAASVLIAPGHENKAYDITGPELISRKELAEAISAITGRQIALTSAAQGAGGSGGFRLSGDFLKITSGAVADLAGRPATTLREFLEANRDKWMPQ
jgi:NAD(P)H dehydrogenase (quinone)